MHQALRLDAGITVPIYESVIKIMIIRTDIENTAARQLATDFNCMPEDFFRYENKVTAIDENKAGSRRLSGVFRAATMGMGAVMSVSSSIMPIAQLIARDRRGTEVCSAETIAVLNRELFGHGSYIGALNQYYLPKTPYNPHVRSEGFEITVLEGEEIKQLYTFKGFYNALLYKSSGERYDMLAVCAVNGRRIMGIAGAAKDSTRLAQIGIDVLPEYRGMGVGTVLVSACADELFRRGMVPYYGTWSGNVISSRLCVDCGFYPAWCEMTCAPFKKEEKQQREKSGAGTVSAIAQELFDNSDEPSTEDFDEIGTADNK